MLSKTPKLSRHRPKQANVMSWYNITQVIRQVKTVGRRAGRREGILAESEGGGGEHRLYSSPLFILLVLLTSYPTLRTNEPIGLPTCHIASLKAAQREEGRKRSRQARGYSTYSLT